jgi:hypothetical protein
VKQTAYTDDRMDPEKATRAAAHHLRDLYHEFGDWYLAIAAYNCGPGTVEKAVERTGYADFWELRSRGVLPAETTNYVPIILAMTIMEKNAAEYGIEGFQLDPPLVYDTVETTAPTSLTLVADILDLPFAELAALNPASLRGMIPENFSLHVPKGSGNPLVAALQLIPANAPHLLPAASATGQESSNPQRAQVGGRGARYHEYHERSCRKPGSSGRSGPANRRAVLPGQDHPFRLSRPGRRGSG